MVRCLARPTGRSTSHADYINVSEAVHECACMHTYPIPKKCTCTCHACMQSCAYSHLCVSKAHAHMYFYQSGFLKPGIPR